jgi:hypothetical protein
MKKSPSELQGKREKAFKLVSDLFRFDARRVKSWATSEVSSADPDAYALAAYINTAQQQGFSMQEISRELNVDPIHLAKIAKMYPRAITSSSVILKRKK